jgi:hypothetical protein
MEEFLEKLIALRKKIREESPLYPFLPPDSTFLEEEKSGSGSGLEITHYGRDTSPEAGTADLPGEKPKEKPVEEEEGEVTFDLPGFRELSLSDLGKVVEEMPETETEEPEKKEQNDKEKYIDLVKNLLEEGQIDQALDEIREMKRLEDTPEEKKEKEEDTPEEK